MPGGCRRETAPLLSTRETVRRRRERSGAPTRIIGRMAQDRLFSGHQTCWPVSVHSLPRSTLPVPGTSFSRRPHPKVPAGGERDLARPRHELEPSCSGHGEDTMIDEQGGG